MHAAVHQVEHKEPDGGHQQDAHASARALWQHRCERERASEQLLDDHHQAHQANDSNTLRFLGCLVSGRELAFRAEGTN